MLSGPIKDKEVMQKLIDNIKKISKIWKLCKEKLIVIVDCLKVCKKIWKA